MKNLSTRLRQQKSRSRRLTHRKFEVFLMLSCKMDEEFFRCQDSLFKKMYVSSCWVDVEMKISRQLKTRRRRSPVSLFLFTTAWKFHASLPAPYVLKVWEGILRVFSSLFLLRQRRRKGSWQKVSRKTNYPRRRRRRFRFKRNQWNKRTGTNWSPLHLVRKLKDLLQLKLRWLCSPSSST
jgi:hypothetical protein